MLSILETVDNIILFIIYNTTFLCLLYFPGLLSILSTDFYIYNNLTPNQKISSHFVPTFSLLLYPFLENPKFMYLILNAISLYLKNCGQCNVYRRKQHHIFSILYKHIFPSFITLLTSIITLFKAFNLCI